MELGQLRASASACHHLKNSSDFLIFSLTTFGWLFFVVLFNWCFRVLFLLFWDNNKIHFKSYLLILGFTSKALCLSRLWEWNLSVKYIEYDENHFQKWEQKCDWFQTKDFNSLEMSLPFVCESFTLLNNIS